MRLSNKLGVGITFLFSLGILFNFYTKAFLHPNEVLMATSPDGTKSFAVFIGHIKNDSTYAHFENMNYPYGQVHAYTDGQTAVANTLKLLSNISPFFETHASAIYNYLFLFSYIFCAVFLFLILRHFSVNFWLSIAGGIGIMLLSPQIHRLGGHPTLVYAAIFPFNWWLFLKFLTGKRIWLYSTTIGVLNSISFFIHPYFILLNGMFLLACWLFVFLKGKRKKYLHYALHIAVQVIVPLLLTSLYTKLIDHHPPRSSYPWGFWWFYATWESVFTPTGPPFDAVFNYFMEDPKRPWEGWSYIGLPSIFVTLFLLWRVIVSVVKRRSLKRILPATSPLLKISLISAILVLLYSMCIPFKWGLEVLVTDVFGFLRQFRSLGRFAWCFYYVFTVFTIYYLWLAFRLLRMKGLKRTAYTLLFVVPLVFYVEAWPSHKVISEKVQEPINWFDPMQLPAEYTEAIDFIKAEKENYQCLVPIPFYHVGAEDFGAGNDPMLHYSMVLAHHANFPQLANSAARTPILEAKNIMQFFSPPFFEKGLEKDLPNKKPFLVLYDRQNLNTQEAYYVGQAEKVFENGLFILARLDHDKVFHVDPQPILDDFVAKKDSLAQLNGFLVSANTDTVIYKSYLNEQDSLKYLNGGAYEGERLRFNFILDRGQHGLIPGKEYIASYWQYNGKELSTQIGMFREVCDSEGNNCQWLESASASSSMVIDGDWSFVEMKFKAPENSQTMSFIMKSFEKEDMNFYIDEFMIRPADSEVYQIAEDDQGIKYLVKNGIKLPKPFHDEER